MLVVVVIYAYPLLFLINTALKSNTEFLVNPTGLVQSPQLANFASAWRQGNFGAYVLNSVLYTFRRGRTRHGDVPARRLPGRPRLRQAPAGLARAVRRACCSCRTRW